MIQAMEGGKKEGIRGKKRELFLKNNSLSFEVPGGFEPPYTVLQTVA